MHCKHLGGGTLFLKELAMLNTSEKNQNASVEVSFVIFEADFQYPCLANKSGEIIQLLSSDLYLIKATVSNSNIVFICVDNINLSCWFVCFFIYN